ncbi:hypothetical protein GCM10020331_077430 [Ectobacillus funiculus]
MELKGLKQKVRYLSKQNKRKMADRKDVCLKANKKNRKKILRIGLRARKISMFYHLLDKNLGSSVSI